MFFCSSGITACTVPIVTMVISPVLLPVPVVFQWHFTFIVQNSTVQPKNQTDRKITGIRMKSKFGIINKCGTHVLKDCNPVSRDTGPFFNPEIPGL